MSECIACKSNYTPESPCPRCGTDNEPWEQWQRNHRGLSGWVGFMSPAHRWYILGEQDWHILGAHCRYSLGENTWHNLGDQTWYILTRLMTPSSAF